MNPASPTPTPYAMQTVCDSAQRPVYFTVEKGPVVIYRFDRRDPAEGALQMCEEAYRAGAAAGGKMELDAFREGKAAGEETVDALHKAIHAAGFSFDAAAGTLVKRPKERRAPA